MLDIKIDGRHGDRRHRDGRAAAPTSASATTRSSPSATSRARRPRKRAQRHRSHGDARLHRHALALRLAAVGQPPRRVEDPPGRDHRGRRQLWVLAGAGGHRVPGRSESVRALRPDGHGFRVALGRRIPAGLRRGRHRAERRPARGPRHAPHRRHGLRAPPAHRRRADDSCSGSCGDAMDEGAWGLSTGLIYAAGLVGDDGRDHRGGQARPRVIAASTPATFAAKAPRCSMRCARRSASVARRSLPVQVSHIKAAGRPNWGKVADALALIDEARAEGLDVMADVYPVHGVQHVAPHRAARLGAGGRRGGDAQAPGRSRRARARSAPSSRTPPTRPEPDQSRWAGRT